MMTTEVKKQRKARPFYPTQRDGKILETIWRFEGMMGAEQIQKLFFGSWHRTRMRLGLLYQQGYIDRPDRRTRAALPQMIYWLTEKGAEYVAGLQGMSLQDVDFRWRAQPRMSLVAHDLWLNDIRIAFVQAVAASEHLELVEWISSSEFWAHPDPIEYPDMTGKIRKRKIRPDAYFAIYNHQTDKTARFLLEVDLRTEENRRIVDEKILPGKAYLSSDAYRLRTGVERPSGRWLFVTTGPTRLANMKSKAEMAAGPHASQFWFAIYSQVTTSGNILTDPFWVRGGNERLVSLIQIES